MTPKAVMKILTGPPGTGKTYRAAREAVLAIDPTVAPSDILRRHSELQDEGLIVWVTFHPSYTYEDFVEGIRPATDSAGLSSFKVVDGVFKKIIKPDIKVDPIYKLKIGEKLGIYHVTEILPGGAVLRNTLPLTRPDRASDYQSVFTDLWSIEKLKSSGITREEIAVAGTNNDKKRELASKTELPPTFFGASSRHAALWHRLDEIEASAETVRRVLVIDEINRADLSRVFGELMTLLELDKRAGEPEEKRITLPYSGEQFTVPATLSVIGTMNTADRSLAVLDYALRRRFTFEEVAPDPLQCAGSYGDLNLGNYLTWMNRVVTALLSRDNRVGHVDLMESRLEAVREQEGWPDDLDGQLRAVAWTIRHKIAPLLLEYFHEDWQRASRALGQTSVEALLSEEDFSDIAGLDANLDLRSSYIMEDWWDPASDSWDPDRFRRYMLAVKDVGSPRAVLAVPATAAAAVAAPAPTAPPTPTATTAAPLPAPEEPETPADADAAPAKQDDEEPGANEDQSAQE